MATRALIGVEPLSSSSESVDDDIDHTEPRRLSRIKLVLLTISFLGVQACWAIQIAHASPLFLKLGVDRGVVAYVWLAGPISGLLVQPIVGTISDASKSRFGRRRPFIVAGVLFTSVAMILLSNADAIGRWFGDAEESHAAAIPIAVIAFCLMDVSLNVLQSPCRAILIDLAPKSQQATGNAYFSFMHGLGNVCGYLLGGLNLVESDALYFFGTNERALFTIAVINLILNTSLTVMFTKEKPLSKSLPRRSICSLFGDLWREMRVMSSPMRRVMMCTFFMWIPWFCVFLYGTDFIATDVYGGDVTAPIGSESRELFDRGVEKGSLALTISASLTILCSPLVNMAIKRFSHQYVWCFGNAVLCVLLTVVSFVRLPWLAIALMAMTGISWTVTIIVPFAMVGELSNDGAGGKAIGVLNIFIVIPQFLVAVSIGPVVGASSPAIALLIGGIGAAIAALCTFLLKKTGVKGSIRLADDVGLLDSE